ncbi:Flagellin N-methylase, partial [Dysosmobacter welbionis]
RGLRQPGQGQGCHERLHPLLHRLRPVPEGVQEGRHSCGERRGCHRLRQVRGLQALHQGLPAGRHPSHRHRGGEGEVQGHQEGPG